MKFWGRLWGSRVAMTPFHFSHEHTSVSRRNWSKASMYAQHPIRRILESIIQPYPNHIPTPRFPTPRFSLGICWYPIHHLPSNIIQQVILGRMLLGFHRQSGGVHARHAAPCAAAALRFDRGQAESHDQRSRKVLFAISGAASWRIFHCDFHCDLSWIFHGCFMKSSLDVLFWILLLCLFLSSVMVGCRWKRPKLGWVQLKLYPMGESNSVTWAAFFPGVFPHGKSKDMEKHHQRLGFHREHSGGSWCFSDCLMFNVYPRCEV